MVDRRAVRDRIGVLRAGRGPRLRQPDRYRRRQRHVLRGIDLLHHRGTPPVPRGGERFARRDPRSPCRPRPFALMPRRIDWWSTLVQLTGTAFFNISTFHALSTAIDAPAFDQSVWRPDARGSICFLVASALAWGEVGHRWWSWRPRDLGWVIAALNLLGSIAFGVSAVAAKVVDDGPRSPELTNLGTSSARSASSPARSCSSRSGPRIRSGAGTPPRADATVRAARRRGSTPARPPRGSPRRPRPS